jgi:hypothetical protein
VPRNAELAILITELGRLRVFRRMQPKKSLSGIAVRLDGGANVTDVNLLHSEKTDSPRVETEEGTVKEVRR